ncbi:ShET2/EspL2 family type III secretion system effector toxin [Pseudomonas caspiana]|nr:ShET2/EspL2 family type III secretion system effector toxin [Pseudomonas caspiana]
MPSNNFFRLPLLPAVRPRPESNSHTRHPEATSSRTRRPKASESRPQPRNRPDPIKPGKDEIYLSSKRGPIVDLNMEVTQPLAECRHLAFNYLFGDEPADMGGGKDFLDRAAKSKAHLQAFYDHPSNPHSRADAGTDQLELITGHNNPLLIPDKFGRWLDDMFSQVVDQQLPEARIMLRTYNHDLPIHIQNKGDRITLAFYDPNDTNVHRRLERYPDQSVSDITFDKAFPDNSGYFEKGRYPFIQAVSKDVGHPADDMKYFRKGSRLPMEVDKSLLKTVWGVSSLRAFLGLCDYMKRKGLVGSKAAPYLSAPASRLRDFAQGVDPKGLNHENQRLRLRVFVTGVAKLKVPSSTAKKLLAPSIEKNRKPLGYCLHLPSQNPGFVADYLALLDTVRLNDADLFDVIRGDPNDNNLAVALEHQKAGDFHLLFDRLETLELGKGRLARLLGATTASGQTSMADAASFSHPDMISVFIERVSQCDLLDTQERYRLLQGKDSDGDTCMQRAAAYEDSACINAYLNALASSGLRSREVVKLLGNPEQDQPNIIPDICAPPSTGWTATSFAASKTMLAGYFEGIAALNLSPASLRKVLAPEQEDALAASRVVLAGDPHVTAAFNKILDRLPPMDAIDLIKGPANPGHSTLERLRSSSIFKPDHEALYFQLLDRQQRRGTPVLTQRSGSQQYAQYQSDRFRRQLG